MDGTLAAALFGIALVCVVAYMDTSRVRGDVDELRRRVVRRSRFFRGEPVSAIAKFEERVRVDGEVHRAQWNFYWITGPLLLFCSAMLFVGGVAVLVHVWLS